MLLAQEILELLWPVLARQNQIRHARIFWTQPPAVNSRIEEQVLGCFGRTNLGVIDSYDRGDSVAFSGGTIVPVVQ
jgi:hypothetical protein